MTHHDDQIITHRVPFLKAGTVIYVAGADSAGQDAYVARNEPHIRALLSPAGFRFIHVPELLESIPEPVLAYLFPLQEGIELPAVYAHIRQTARLGERAGLLYKRGWRAWFRELPDDAPERIERELEALAAALEEPREVRKRERKAGRRPSIIWKGPPSLADEFYDEEAKIGVAEASIVSREVHRRRFEEPPFEGERAAVLDEVDRILERYGITVEQLYILLGYRVKLSRLRITPSGRIFLPDFDREVRMNQLSKALYFLYLRHPEGIRFKEVADHRQELLDIYMGLTGREDTEEIGRTIDHLVDPFGNEMNVCASRIKAAFLAEVGELVAKAYCLQGRPGEKKEVPLDRDFVIWEH